MGRQCECSEDLIGPRVKQTWLSTSESRLMPPEVSIAYAIQPITN